MRACVVCGVPSPEGARFCSSCGAAMARDEEEAGRVRKVVTVVFTDLAGSTGLGERLDPESLTLVMGFYFERTRAVLERHGGTVQKFIGDAVMAVFGIPVVREDDALRAVRAAAELQTALTALNTELVRDHGVALELRTGVNTGEVLAGDPATAQALALGDTVNVAARLEQVANSGEVLLGHATWALVRDAVEVTALDPLTLKARARRWVRGGWRGSTRSRPGGFDGSTGPWSGARRSGPSWSGWPRRPQGRARAASPPWWGRLVSASPALSPRCSLT
jgi:class 3 adenylate cyclase